MSRYDGLIIPRSYSEYINKTDAATLQQALQLSGVLSGAVAEGDNKAVTSNAVNGALENLNNIHIDRTTYEQTSGNFDEIKEVAFGVKYYWLRYGSDYLNTPMNNADWIILELIGTHSCRITQRAYCQKIGKRTEIYERSFVNATSSGGSWTSWEKLATESDFNKKLSNIPQAGTSLTDCNNAPIGFACNNNVAHTPNNTTKFVYILTLHFDNNPLYQYQMCFLISDNTIFTRVRINGTWENWVSK